MRTLVFLIFVFVFAGNALAIRTENLPAFCANLYPKLLTREKRPLTDEEISQLLDFSAKPENLKNQLLASFTPEEKRSFLEKLIVLRWQLKELPPSKLQESHTLSVDEIKQVFPKASSVFLDSDQHRDKLSRSVLSKRVEKAANQVAEYLGKTSSPNQGFQNFKELLDILDNQDQSWYHQSTIDSLIDLASGIQTRKISDLIRTKNHQEFNQSHQGEETYAFANPELLLTPYSEIFNLFEAVGVKSTDTVVDLGAGFGRVGLALAAKYPGITIHGYEIVKDRIEEGARIAKAWGLSDRVNLVEQNLADPKFKPEPADVYFAFNPVSGETFDKILEDLRTVGLKSGKRFRFIVFGPSPFHKTDAQPWLRELTGPEIPKGSELKIYEFLPEKASHTEVVDSENFKNPYALKPAKDFIPEFPASRPLTPGDFDLIQEASNRPETSHNSASFLSPNYLTSWASGFPIEVAQQEDQVLVFSRKTGEANKESFIEPLGGTTQDKVSLIKKVLLEKKARGISVEFSYLSQEVHEALLADTRIESYENPSFSDFIYSATDLSELSRTKKLRDRSNQSSAFQKSHPQAEIHIFSKKSAEDKKALQELTQSFLDSWLEDRLDRFSGSELEREFLIAEGRTSQALVDKLLGPKTIQIAVTEKPLAGKADTMIAYASGEVREDSQGKKTLLVYVQKSNGTKNSIPFINQALVQEVLSQSERFGQVDYVNMMDASTPGLKQFKLQYEPNLNLGKTYSAKLK